MFLITTNGTHILYINPTTHSVTVAFSQVRTVYMKH